MINHEIKTLKNGLRVVLSENQNTEAVTILILVGVGGRYEADDQKGISHFLEHLFFKGSKKRPTAFEIAKELDSLGANSNAFTGEEYTGFYVQTDANDLEKSLDIISDMFLNPLFNAEEIEREKGVILQEANMYHDMPQAYVQILNQKQMFGSHPLGFDLVGDQEHIKKITREDIVNYRENLYSPENTIVVVSGNPKGANWFEMIEEKFANTARNKASEPVKFNLENAKTPEKLVQDVRKVDQTHLVLSYFGIPKTDKRRYALTILNTLLGGSMSSRLFTEIREKRALAYYVRSNHSAYKDTGIFSVMAGVEPDKLPETIKIIQKEIKDLVENGPSDEELKRAKGNIRGSLAISLEDSFEIGSFLAEELLYADNIRSIEEIIQSIESVTSDEIKALSGEIFQKDRMGLSIIGPKDYGQDLQEIL